MTTLPNHSMQHGTLSLGPGDLTPRAVWTAARKLSEAVPNLRVSIDGGTRERIARAANAVVSRAAGTSPVYGLNTGVGALRHVVIERDHLAQLQVNLLRSHACGVGEALPRATVAAMWIHWMNSAAQGHRGVRLETVDACIDLLNRGVLATVPSRGSVGASGDLAPAAHAALLLIGEGVCSMPDSGEIRTMPAAEALRRTGRAPLTLGAKEALSLINGTHLTTALACQVWTEAETLWRVATFAAALSTYGFRANPQVTRAEVLDMHHPATLYAGLRKQEWFSGATNPPVFRNYQQDPYCFRCTPQVHGAVWKEIEQSEEWIVEELGATTDNPVVLETGEFAHGGNFHAIFPARVLDRLASALTQLASISERRTNLGMDSRKTGLPDFLTPEGGLNSGLMMTQTTAAALVSECKTLSFPASVDSIPTNCDQEDHVSMGPIAGLKAVRICGNARDVLAIEILAACQAVHLRGAEVLPPRLRRVYEAIRQTVPPIECDRTFAEDIRAIAGMIEASIEDDALFGHFANLDDEREAHATSDSQHRA